ncbi:MAG TPA: hypothetical protein VM536_03015 [Chloroflexia bacterium]|nr:hypothetical protein [Chloroflexia bacterium]
MEFDRYDGAADYAAVRVVVDQICEGLRLTITDDPDPGPEDDGEPGGGFMGKLRGLFGR